MKEGDETGIITRTTKEKVINWFYPPRCPVCNGVLWEKGLKCHSQCYSKLLIIGDRFCTKCGKSIQDETAEFCVDCSKKKHVFTQGRAVYEYKNEIKNSIYNYKYKNKREYASFYAEEIEKYLGDWIRLISPDALIPVPLHTSKLRSRGYNQAEIIAKKLGEKMNIEVCENLVIRSKNTVPQKELSDNKRKKNVKKAFKLCENIVKLRIVMIIDDIYTTGATMDAISEALIEAGVEKIYCISLCIGKGF